MQQRALLVGINDFGDPRNNLHGCVNDALNLKRFLIERGWPEQNIRVLLDRDATKVNVISGFRELAAATGPEDVALFGQSSHGTSLPDDNGDEKDHLDEALCCADCLTGPSFAAGCIRDDEIAAIVAGIPRGAAFLMWADACHSGDLERDPERRPKFLAPPDPLPFGGLVNQLRALRRRRRGEIILPDTHAEVLLSGCAANQTSADAYEDGQFQGAFTWAMLKALRAHPRATLSDAHAECLRLLEAHGYSQTPQLEGSRGHLGAIVFPPLAVAA